MFTPIQFAPELNVILAEIRLPENRKKDTHNLGKTTLGRLLDFCLLSGKDPKFFLFKHADLFRDFVFFLEIELADASYLTVRRGVRDATLVSFKKHEARNQDFTGLPGAQWDHFDMPFDRATEMLDSLLDWRALKPWSYRRLAGYLLRSQDDFHDVFHLRKFVGSQSEWKPLLAHILGFDDDLITRGYKQEEALKDKEAIEKTLKQELGGSMDELSKIEGLLLLKQQEAARKQVVISAFDFQMPDRERTEQLVNEIDVEIASLNQKRYALVHNRKKVLDSLEDDQILFSPEAAQELFHEAGIMFKGQIMKDFEQLIAFNKAMTQERRAYLQEERTEIEEELALVNLRLAELGQRRSATLSFLSDTDAFSKYRQLSDDLVRVLADITALERQQEYLRRLRELRRELGAIADESSRLHGLIVTDVEQQNQDRASLFSKVRLHFNEIVEEVLDRKALLSVFLNKKGHVEFKAEILDEGGNATSADLGHTYRKLLCVAFDLAVLRAHLGDRFPRFVYHNGVLESLDDRKKEILLSVIRRHAKLGIQIVITLIDSDLPHASSAVQLFAEHEIVLSLHDEGEQGRLFKMPAW